MNKEEISNKIGNNPYYEIIIRPIKDENIDLFRDHAMCQEFIKNNYIDHKGYEWPSYSYTKVNNYNNYIENYDELSGVSEFWRAYLSGQIISISKSVPLKRSNYSSTLFVNGKDENANQIAIQEILYRIWLPIEFANRMVSTLSITSGIKMIFKIGNISNFKLTYYKDENFTFLRQKTISYETTIGPILIIMESLKLIADPIYYAMEFSRKIFPMFQLELHEYLEKEFRRIIEEFSKTP